MSAPIKINTREPDQSVDWIWGGRPYQSFYVASNGNDSAAGTKKAPLATVRQALQNLAAAYAADASWPNKGESDEAGGGIIILDEVAVEEQIDIDGSVGYPPIILCDDPSASGGKLQALASIGAGNNLLRVSNNAQVTLEGGLILAGTGNTADNISGVYLYISEFIMNGGEISGNSASSGGGVYLYLSEFIMDGGEISGNSAGVCGGGVYFLSTAASDQIAKTGGTIYGYDGSPDNPLNNTVKGASNNIVNNKGHAIYRDESYSEITHCQETTMGPNDVLYYNYPR